MTDVRDASSVRGDAAGADVAVVTKAEFARRHGWGKSYVSKLAGEGRLVLTEDGRVLVAESLQRIRDTTRAIERASEPAVQPMARADRDRKDFYDAENARLDLEERLGKLLSRSEAVAIVANAGVHVRTRLEAFAPRLSAQLAGMGGDEQRIQAALRQEVQVLLDDLSRRFAKLAHAEVGADAP